jgi:WD40 repeat protein
MMMTLTCKCGTKFPVDLKLAGQQASCPGCGKTAQIPTPKRAAPKPAPLPPPVEEEEEIKLQDLPTPEAVIEVEEVVDTPSAIEEDDGTGYGLGDEDELAGVLSQGQGIWCTMRVIRLELSAPCIAYGVKGAWALAGQDDNVCVIDMKAETRRAYFKKHEAEVTAVALAARAPVAVSADEEGTILLWDVPSCKPRKRFRGHEGPVDSLAVTPTGKYALSGGDDGRVRLWNLEAGTCHRLAHSDWGDEWDEAITFVSFSRDGERILAGGSEGHIAMWDIRTGKRIRRYAGIEEPISCVRLSDEGGHVTATTEPISSGGYSYIVISHWDSATGKPIKRLNLAVESVPCCLVPDQGGKRIIVAGGSSNYAWMGAFNLEDGFGLHAFDGMRGSPRCLAVAPNNTRFIAALDDAALQIFSMAAY